MALLDTAARFRVAAQLMRDIASPCTFTKTDLRAAVDATDQWMEDNTPAWNASLPNGFRIHATPVQKAMLFAYVLLRRTGRLRAEEDG